MTAYAISEDVRGAVARGRLRDGGVVSVQVFNAFVRVCRKTLRLDGSIIATALAEFRALVDLRPVAVFTHDIAVALARDHGLDIDDAPIVAAALGAGCDRLSAEDLQHGRRFGDRVIVNPFANADR